MKKWTFLGIAVLSTICILSTAEARTYHRSCRATFRIIPFQRGLDPRSDAVKVELFYARASGGTYIPNTIRLRAYRRLRNCINSAWADPLNGSVRGIPAECTNSDGVGVFEYNPHPSLLEYMKNRACEEWGRDYQNMSVAVRIVADIWGNKGCGGDRISKKTMVPVAGAPNTPMYELRMPQECP